MLAESSRTWWLVVLAGIAFGVAPVTSHRLAIRVEPATAARFEDVWAEHADGVDVVVSNVELAELARRGVHYRVIVDDVDAAAESERARLAHRASKDWFAEYRDGAELDAFLDRLAARHPSTVKVRAAGRSHEGRAIRAIEVSRGGAIPIVIDGGHHAREWLSVMVPACIADRLARAEDPRVDRVLRSVRFVIAPLVNPDGYAYSWTTDRYWRKNRHGDGVDLGRNYSVGWGGAGSSGDPRSPNYRGEYAFSEPEARALRTLFDAEHVAAHVDIHAYSQVIVYPWSHQRAEPKDAKAFAAIAERMRAAIAGTHGVAYDVRPGSTLQRGAGGTAGDWSYGERGALSFLVELRPASAREGGFVVPPEQIVPTCDETLNAVVALAESVIERERAGQGGE